MLLDERPSPRGEVRKPMVVHPPLSHQHSRNFPTEESVPAELQIGDHISGIYAVTDILGQGGMGKVYKVHDESQNLDMAVKSPLLRLVRTEAHRESFVREAETWVNLDLHPHIVTCYYVRVWGGIPRVLAEFVGGGSLKKWIDERRLYEGKPEEAMERILDIAIQFAWGLHHAHERGIIHQDIKPANVILTPDGIVKVTDFGLAKAQAMAETTSTGEGQSALVSWRGMTRAYCSPEQASYQPLSHKTDIWSWGLSIMEMFVGQVTWPAGQAAAEVLASYLRTGWKGHTELPVPIMLSDLLKQCFQHAPKARPDDMLSVADTLQEIYRHLYRRPHPRQMPQAAELRADSSNNRALSLMDLGKREDAEAAWGSALQYDPLHIEATYNLGLLHWRTGRQTDLELIEKLKLVTVAQPSSWRAWYLLGSVQLERGDRELAETAFRKATQLSPRESEVEKVLASLEHIQSTGCVRTFEGHKSNVNAVAITPDGHYAVSGSGSYLVEEVSPSGEHLLVTLAQADDLTLKKVDHTIRIWDLDSGHCVGILSDPLSLPVYAIALTPDGRYVISGGGNFGLSLWSLFTGRRLCQYEGLLGGLFRGHKDSVNAVALTPDGHYAVSGSNDKTLRLWDIANSPARGVGTASCLRTFKGHRGAVTAVALTPDSLYVVSGSDDMTLRLWELSSGHCLRIFTGHQGGVNAVAVTLDGRYAMSAGLEHTLRLWELATGECQRVFSGHEESVNTVALTSDGRYAISGGADRTLRVWELNSGCCLRTFEVLEGPVLAVSVTPDGHYAVTGSTDNKLRLWQIRGIGRSVTTGALSRPLDAIEATRIAAGVQGWMDKAHKALKDRNFAEAGAALRHVRSLPGYERETSLMDLWHQVSLGGHRIGLRGVYCRRTCYNKTIEGHKDAVVSIVLTEDGSHAISGGVYGTLRVWETISGKCIRVFSAHDDLVKAIALTSDGRYVLSCSRDGSLRKCDLTNGRRVRTFRRHIFDWHKASVNALALTPDGHGMVSGSEDNTLRLWDMVSGRCLHIYKGHEGAVTAVAITRDGCHIVSGSSDKTLRLWELANNRCINVLRGHDGEVQTIAIAADGQHVVSGSSDKTLRLWSLGSGRCLQTLNGHEDAVLTVALTSDGRYAVSGSQDKTLRFWELTTGRCLRTLEGHTESVYGVAITLDGRYVVSGSLDTTLRLWELDWDYAFHNRSD